MIITNLLDAKSIVIENFPNAENMPLTLNLILEASRATEGYRPFFTTANMIFNEYRKLTQAETVKFEYNLDNIKSLLGLQSALDKDLSGIKDGYLTDDLLNKISDIFQASFYTNGMYKYE